MIFTFAYFPQEQPILRKLTGKIILQNELVIKEYLNEIIYKLNIIYLNQISLYTLGKYNYGGHIFWEKIKDM